ncbi:molybdate ABC transporter substrate-binding protein [Agromyces mangrovi Wang et al. 2018]|uniref:molybdate ABC transporter substrate-binding protein n=1 Tax=Agromyces mangrovi TaxID=1858653 RepID=UPI002572CF56|nr:molybdate ABC transporter substrate-binding protein [Agromyces mangrovi]BDZ65555.1 molybdate-binding protein [Agromyces mangrovi]
MTRRHRRGAGAAAASVVALAALSGCSGSDAFTPGDPPGATITVFAAASLTESFEQLEAAFEADHPGVEVALSFGGSATLASQILEGAPADVFAAADEATMRRVVDADATATEPEVFATNALALAVPAGNPGGVTGLADLADDDLAIALCAPEVPCGAATVTVLDAAGIVAAPDTLEQDVKAVLTRLVLGEADAGLVYRTDVVAAGDAVEQVEAAGTDAAVNAYPIAAVGTTESAVAREFIAFVRSDTGQGVLADAGFGAP